MYAMTLSDAFFIMKAKDSEGNKIPFDITWQKCSITKRTGGEIVTYRNVVKIRSPRDDDEMDIISVNNLTNSHHKTKIHMHLILKINGKHVIG